VFPWFVGVGDVGERATERHVRMGGKRSLLCVSLFYPKTVLVCPDSVNLWACLFGISLCASAQSLDFLVKAKNPRFRV